MFPISRHLLEQKILPSQQRNISSLRKLKPFNQEQSYKLSTRVKNQNQKKSMLNKTTFMLKKGNKPTETSPKTANSKKNQHFLRKLFEN